MYEKPIFRGLVTLKGTIRESIIQKDTDTFKFPQDEIEHIKIYDGTLMGFARICRILQNSYFFEFHQLSPALALNWTCYYNHEINACHYYTVYRGCMGTVLHWFFERSEPLHFYWHEDGIRLLANYLDIDLKDLERIIRDAAKSVAEKQFESFAAFAPFYEHSLEFKPFIDDWTVDPALVFEELARRYPGK